MISERQKSSLFHRGIIGAGQTVQLSIAGDKFFLDVASGPLWIRPDTGNENEYFPSMGLKFDREKKSFSLLQVQNRNSFAVYYQLFAGFDDLDDRRLTYPSIQFKRVMHPVFDYLNDPAATSVAIPDLSGTTITDLNGDEFYAIERLLVYLFNVHNSESFLICFGNPSTLNAGSVYFNSSIQLPMTGDLRVQQGTLGAVNVTGFISELYNCLPVPT